MQPIRGPIDYNRYPPRPRRRNSAAQADEHGADASAQPNMTDSGEAEAAEGLPQRRRPPRHRRAVNSEVYEMEGVAHPQNDVGERHINCRTARRVTAPQRGGQRTLPAYDASFLPQQNFADESDEHDGPAQPPLSKQGRRSKQPNRKRAPLWKRVRRWCGILLIIICLEFVVALLTAPHFAIERIEVEGLGITAPQDVAGVQSTLRGQNWLRASLPSAAANLETLPTVREAHITRDFRWPPQVTVHIQERQPFARVGAGNDWWIVDQEGMPFRRANLKEARDEALYAVTGPTLRPEIGKLLPGKTWQPVREFALSLSRSEQKGTRWSLRRLYFDKQGFASLRLTGGAHDEMLIQMGSDNWSKKLQRARQALTYFEATGRRAAVLNLISYSMPTWTPHPEQKSANTATNAAELPEATTT